MPGSCDGLGPARRVVARAWAPRYAIYSLLFSSVVGWNSFSSNVARDECSVSQFCVSFVDIDYDTAKGRGRKVSFDRSSTACSDVRVSSVYLDVVVFDQQQPTRGSAMDHTTPF